MRIDVESIGEFKFAFVRIVWPAPTEPGHSQSSQPEVLFYYISRLCQSPGTLYSLVGFSDNSVVGLETGEMISQSDWDSLQQPAIRSEAQAAGTVGSWGTLLACVSSLEHSQRVSLIPQVPSYTMAVRQGQALVCLQSQ